MLFVERAAGGSGRRQLNFDRKPQTFAQARFLNYL